MKKLDLAQIKTKPSLVNVEEAEIKAVEDLHTRAEDLNATQVVEITPTTVDATEYRGLVGSLQYLTLKLSQA